MRAVSLAVVMLLAAMPAHADDAVCTLNLASKLFAETRSLQLDLARKPALLYAYSRLPIGGQAQIAVGGQRMPAGASSGGRTGQADFASLRVVVTDAASADAYDKAEARQADRLQDAPAGAGKQAAFASETADGDVETNFVGGLDATPAAAESDNPLVIAKRIAPGDLLVGFTVPSPYAASAGGYPFWPFWPLWTNARVMVIACDATNKLVFASIEKDMPLSFRSSSILLALIPAALIYLSVALASRTYDKRNKKLDAVPANGRRGWLQALDPVRMTSGPDGKGSLARLQILFFTLLISFTLAFLLLRIGFLSDMSDTVVELLGISAVGAAAAKAAEGTQTRLSAENWAWLTSHYWLPENGLGPYTSAKWSDLVTSPEDGFDVYHFQMLVFSLVVGVALLQAGYTDIASFKIPTTLLEVLGLSQVAYVGGKLVAPPAYGDLDKLLTELRRMEDDYIKLCFADRESVGQNSDQAKADKMSLTARMKAAQVSYELQMKKVEAYFNIVYGDLAKTSQYTERAPIKGLADVIPC